MTLPIEQWRALLRRQAESCSCFGRVHVLDETASTQDAALELGCGIGDVVTTLRQTTGRGRLGRTWQDTGPDGLAMTFVLAPGPAPRLSIGAAVAMAVAAESLLDRAAGLKWPNDLFIDGRKAGGALIEQRDGRALVGIGLNVSQQVWPAELRGRAISLFEAGLNVQREAVAAAMMRGLAAAMSLNDEQLEQKFVERDVLRGAQVRVRCGDRTETGRVLAIRPMHGLQLQTSAGEVWLPAATSTIEEFQLAGSREPGGAGDGRTPAIVTVQSRPNASLADGFA